MNVEEVRVGILDAAGAPIKVVYVKNAPHYAIYGTDERVKVHFADAGDEAQRQVAALAPLNPVRSEINSLIDGWRAHRGDDEQARTKLFDRRIATSLELALQNDSPTALSLLKSALDEITEERQSTGRVEHLRWAVATVLVIGLLAAILWAAWDPQAGLEVDENALLFALAVGAFGAVVSIAIAIRDRVLKTDLQSRDNITDAILRVSVGAVGAVLLVAMLRTDLIDVAVGHVDLDGMNNEFAANQPATTNSAAEVAGPQTTAEGDTNPSPAAGNNAADASSNEVVSAANTAQPAAAAAGGPARAAAADNTDQRDSPRADRHSTNPLILLVVAFFAGFAERLVNQLAERIQFSDVAVSSATAAAVERRGGAALSAGPPPPDNGSGGAAVADRVTSTDEATDGCIADAVIPEEELTDDTQLPPATGGVEDPPAVSDGQP